LLGQAGLNVTAAFAVCLGSGTATGFVAGQPIQLGVQAAGGKLLGRGYFLAALPPLTLLGRLRHGLWPSFGLGRFRTFGRFTIYRFFLLA
jgi:hypothetical protein